MTEPRDTATGSLAFPAARLAEALALADAAPTVREAARHLREAFPPLRVVVVDAFDMRHEKAAAEGARVRLFLAASDGHCWNVTEDSATVSGIFVSGRD